MPIITDAVAIATLNLPALQIRTAGVWVYRFTNSPQVKMTIGGSESPVHSSTGWRYLSCAFTADGSVDVELVPVTYGTDEVYFDGLIVVDGTYSGTYFDGNTIDTASVDYSWAGAANASTSLRIKEYGVDGGQNLLAAGTATGDALQYLQLVESSEQGLLFIGKQGQIVFRERNTFSSGFNSLVFADDGSGIPFTAAEVTYGTDLLFNQVTVTYPGGTAIADNTVSQGKYGLIKNDIDTLLASGTTAGDLASYYVEKYGDPEYRFSTIEVSLVGIDQTMLDEMLDLEIGDLVEIRFTPNGVGSPIGKMAFVTSIQHDILVNDHRMSIGISDVDFIGLVLDDVSLGILDIGLLAF